MALKRQNEGRLDAVFTKKPRPTPAEDDLAEAHLTSVELSALTHEELVQTVVVLQKALAASKTSVNTTFNEQPANTWATEKVADKASTIRRLVNKEIKKQMKWQPSCKTGKTEWSYKGMVPCQEVFDKIFKENEVGKKKVWKMKKFSLREFEEIFGAVEASCRYNDLRITSESVNVKWDPEELTFQMSGTYGV